jgi:hypothetical protein
VLKISTIGKEWAGVAEQQLMNLELYHTLTQIDGMILKYITTNQSLYI